MNASELGAEGRAGRVTLLGGRREERVGMVVDGHPGERDEEEGGRRSWEGEEGRELLSSTSMKPLFYFASFSTCFARFFLSQEAF